MAYFYKERTLVCLTIAGILLTGWFFASASWAAVNAMPHENQQMVGNIK